MSFGWGGAMGPAQFIPSTWQLYKSRLSSILGKTPNPWDIRDSFLAAALLLKDNGAKNGDVNSEWQAAMLYFSGSLNPKYSFYGDNVMALAEKYRQDINTLNQNR
jgi:membrane-bound lytic murein transglycosylase B